MTRITQRLLLLGMLVLLMAVVAVPRTAWAQDYYVYVAAESDDEVSVVRFDGENATVEETVTVGYMPTETEGPHGMTVGLEGDYWYLSIAHGKPFGRLVKYETGTNRKVGEVELDMFPATMQISPATGLLYVVNFNLHGKMKPSSVSVVDPQAMEEVARVETGAMPHGSRIGPDGMKHYSVAMMSGNLYEINAVTFEVARTLNVGEGMPKPTWVQPHPSKPLAYVANNGADEVVEVNLDDWTITRRFETGAGPYNLDVTPDGEQLVVTYKSGGETAIWNLETGEEQARIANSRGVSHGVVISPDGRYAFVSAEGVGAEAGVVDVFDLETLECVGTAEVGKQAGGIAFWKQTDAGGAQASGAGE